MTRLALLLALLTACVSPPKFVGIGDQADAGAQDAAPVVGDASVYATMRNGSDSPAIGVHVVFTDPAGTITFEGNTDGTGIAMGSAVEGGTLFAAFTSPPTLVVIANIKPGDTYRIGEPRHALQPILPTAALTVSRYMTTQSYLADSRCGSGAKVDTTTTPMLVIPFTWTEGCASGEQVGVLVIAKDGIGGSVASHYIEVQYPASSIIATGSYSLPASTALNLSAPSDVQLIHASIAAVDHGHLFAGPDGPMMAMGDTTASVPFFAAAAGGALQMSVDIFDGNDKGSMSYYAALGASPLSVAADLSTAVRPQYISTLSIPALPDAPVTWAVSDGQPSPLALLDVQVTHPPSEGGKTHTVRYLFEPTQAAFARPQIPTVDEFKEFQPVDADSATGHLELVRYSDSAIDYGALRTGADYMTFKDASLGQRLLAVPDAAAVFLSGS